MYRLQKKRGGGGGGGGGVGKNIPRILFIVPPWPLKFALELIGFP